MNAHEIADRLVLYEQSHVINELIRVNDELWERVANSEELDDVLEWWLVTPILADELKDRGEVIFSDYDCYWWGRQTSRQAVYMDGVIEKIAEEW